MLLVLKISLELLSNGLLFFLGDSFQLVSVGSLLICVTSLLFFLSFVILLVLFQAVFETTLTRILLPLPVLVIPPFAMQLLEG